MKEKLAASLNLLREALLLGLSVVKGGFTSGAAEVWVAAESGGSAG